MRLSCALFVLFAAAAASAQTNTGQISGTVRDASGGVLPGVTVTVSNVNTGLARSEATATNGFYVVTNLAVGTYSVTAELELARTRSWSYSVMNVNGLTELAVLGQQVGVDLWHFATPDGRSIRSALRYLAPYAVGERQWTHQQISGWTPDELFPVLRRAPYTVTEDRVLLALIHKVPAPAPADRANLTNIKVS